MLANLPLWQLILGGVVLPSVLAGVIAVIVRRLLPIELLSANNDLVAITYPVVGLVYGVFLAFAIVIVWQRFSDAESATYHEVASLSALWRDAAAMPSDDRTALQHDIHDYVVSVQTQEWPRMALPDADQMNDQAFERLWKTLYTVQPRTDLDKMFFQQALTDLHDAGQHRRERLLFSQTEMPHLLWSFLLFGAFVTVAWSFFIGTRSVYSHALMCIAITSLVCFSLALVLSLSKPFSGDVSISNRPYADMLKSVR